MSDKVWYGKVKEPQNTFQLLIRERESGGTQICVRCGKTQPLTKFFIQSGDEGFRVWCNECLSPEEFARFEAREARCARACDKRVAGSGYAEFPSLNDGGL